MRVLCLSSVSIYVSQKQLMSVSGNGDPEVALVFEKSQSSNELR